MQYQKQTLLNVPLTEKQKSGLNNIARLYSDIRCPVYTYKEDGRRVLIISDIIAPDDDNNGILFSDKEKDVYNKVLSHAIADCAKDVEIEKISLINWQSARPEVSDKGTIQDRKRSSECNRIFWSRIKFIIKKFRPDSVIACGIDPFVYMFRELIDPNKEAIQIKTRFNRVFDAELDGHSFKFTGTIDLYRPCTWDVKHKQFANLLGYLKDGLTQGIQGYNWFTVDLPDPKIIYLDTVEKFDKFFKKLVKAEIVAIDSEGDGKGRLTSKLYCLQFAFDKYKGYFLPLDHPDTPFSSKELKHIKDKLRYYFEFERAKKYHIYQYGKYDIGQLYAQIGIRFYNHRVYDTMGGQFLLNENISLLKKYGFKKPYTPLSLGVIAAQNGCYIYEEIEFSKGDRGNISREGLTKRFIEYSTIDATVLIAIQEYQIARAKHDGHKRFLLYNCEQISDTLISLAQMENVGAPLDRKQFYILKSKEGPINTSINKQLQSFKESKAAQAVNKYLIKKQGLPSSGGMFGGDEWIFDINKPYPQYLLFYKALKLKPLALKKDGTGKVDKAFLKEYSETCPEVKVYKEYKAAITLRNNFVNKIYDKIHKDNDTLFDGRLRSSYTYTLTTTGRLSSVDPNLQNLTARGDWAPHLKRGFISPRRCIIVKADMSANEVRDWCNQSGDPVLRKSFYKGLKLRQELQILLLKNPENWTSWLKIQEDTKWGKIENTEKETVLEQKERIIAGINDPITREIGEASLRLELEGDLHKQNCVIMYELKSTLDVTGDQRYDIKAITFGKIYGKIAMSYAKPKSEGGLGKTEEECEAIMDRFSSTFEEGTKWLDQQYAFGENNFYVDSPLGMRRHLGGYYHTRRAIINAMNRRAPNSMIQGTSSNIGIAAIRAMQKLFWHLWVKHGKKVYWKTTTNYVHDAIESIVPISQLPIFLYLKYHAMTTLVHRRFTKVFGYDFKVGLEGEVNLGATLSECKDVWQFDYDTLKKMVKKCIDFHNKELGYNYSDKEVKEMFGAVKHNWNIISQIRLKELKHSVKSDKAVTIMLLTEETVNNYDFILEGEDGKMFRQTA